jgi:hypothetical protein
MTKDRNLIEKIGNEIYNWFNAITKKIEKEHPGITWGYEKNDKTWVVYSRQNTLLLKMGVDNTNGYFIFEYLVDLDGSFGLKSGRTRDKERFIGSFAKTGGN